MSTPTDIRLQVMWNRLIAVVEEQAQALTLIAFYGWDIEEISRFLGRTQGATREYLSQSRKKLRPFLEPCHEYLAP